MDFYKYQEMNIMRKITESNIIKNIKVFIILICIFCLIKIFACVLPSDLVNKNVQDSWIEFERAGLYPMEPLVSSTENWERDSYGQIDFFTELIMINFANTVTGNNPISDSMRNPYSSVQNAYEYNPLENLKASTMENHDIIEAPQYWWGLAALYRILFSIFTYDQILIIYKFILYLMLFCCFKKIADNLDGKIGMIFIISLLICNFFVVAYSPNLGITFIISFAGILAFFSKGMDHRDFTLIMVIMGATTAYLDWMSTPIITYQIPVCIAILYMGKNGILKNIKDYIFFLVKTALGWSLAYGGALLMKWILSAIILNENIFTIVRNRVSAGLSNDGTAQFKNGLEYSIATIKRNMSNLLPDKLDIIGSEYLIILILLVLCIFILGSFCRRSMKIELIDLTGALCVLSLAPIVWYIVFKGHTYIHFWFTYRSLIGMIMCLLLSLLIVAEGLFKERTQRGFNS